MFNIPQHILDMLKPFDIKVYSTGVSNKKEHVDIRILQKGNKDIINRLILLGWRKITKEKEKLILAKNKYQGYVFYIILRYDL